MSLTVSAILAGSIISATAETVAARIDATADLAVVTRSEEHSHYQGGVTYTPSDSVQIVATKDLVLDDDITINPIPSNYGRVEWNGAFLTVS